VSTTSILVMGLGVVLALPIVWRIAQRRFDPFEPIVLFTLAWGAMFVVRPTAMLIDGNLSYFGRDISSTLPRALMLAFTGGVAFLVAYEVHVGRRLARRLPSPRVLEPAVAGIGAIAMAVLAFTALVIYFKGFSHLNLLFGGRFDESGRILRDSSTYPYYASFLIVPAAVLLVGLAFRTRSLALRLGAAAAVALAVLRTAPLGDRVVLLPLFGGLLVFAYVGRGRRPGLPMLVVMLAGALVASYALLLYRYPESRSGVLPALESIGRHPSRPFRPILRGRDAEMAPVLAGALQVVPKKLHYRYGGAVLGDLVSRPIPRQLWNGKPDPPDQKVTETTWPGTTPYFDPSYTPVLFFYWDFGIYGVIAGMAVFGLAARAFFEWFLRFRDRLSAQLIFAVAVWFVVIGARDDPVDVISLAAFVVLPLIVVDRLALLRSRTVPRFLATPVETSER
jgi:hypothetical protein